MHISSGAALFACWIFLSRWYQGRDTIYYLLFVAVFAAVFLFVGWPYLKARLPRIPFFRLLLIAGIGFFALPWAEWTQRTSHATREKWTHQLFLEFVFVYIVLLSLTAMPFLIIWVEKIAKTWKRPFQKPILFLPAGLFFLGAAGISLLLFKSTPILPDSSAHLFQAKIFQQGKLFAPAPPLPDLFAGPLDLLQIRDGKWFGIYPPGYSLLLAGAMFLDAEWLLSPLLGAFTLLIWISYARRWHGPKVALVLGWLSIISPFLLLMSSTVMVPTPELFFASLIVYFSRRLIEDGKMWHLLVLFIALVGGILVRFFSILMFIMPVLVYVSWTRIKSRDFLLPVTIVLGLSAGLTLLLYYQWKTTGNPLLAAYMLEFPGLGWGFGEHAFARHDFARALENTSNNLLGIDLWLTGFPSGSLLFLIGFFALESRLEKWDIVLLSSCGSLLLFYFLFLFQDLWFGPRYWYVAAPFLLLLTARSVQNHRSLQAIMLIGIILVLASRLPGFLQRYSPQEKQAGILSAEIRKVSDTKTLVFLDDEVSQNFVNWNDPFLREPVILCRDPGSRQKEVERVFPGYHPVFYRMNLSFDKKNLHSRLGFYREPDTNPAGYVSLFEVAAAVVAANDYSDRDCFDIAYVDLFNSNEPTSSRLSYLEEEDKKAVLETRRYKRNFRIGLIHTARMLLLPKLAFEKNGKRWNEGFSFHAFHQERASAVEALKASGDIGKTIITQLEKVRLRIDRNQDNVLSDKETYQFLSQKFLLVIGGDSL